jgi:hypothetical protein
MTTGMCAVAGCSLSARQVSKPSISGIMTSSRTTSGAQRAATARASAPLAAIATS